VLNRHKVFPPCERSIDSQLGQNIEHTIGHSLHVNDMVMVLCLARATSFSCSIEFVSWKQGMVGWLSDLDNDSLSSLLVILLEY
jgi:hypothetical protein